MAVVFFDNSFMNRYDLRILPPVPIFETVAQKRIESRFCEKPYNLCHFSVIVTRKIIILLMLGVL